MIISAVENNEFLNKIKELYYSRVYKYDIDTTDAVIDLLKKYENIEKILITKMNLKGNIIEKEYIKEIVKIKNTRIVLLIEKLTDEIKEFLFANEIFSIIEGKHIDVQKVYETIEKNEKVVYRSGDNNIEQSKDNLNIKTIKKQFISVFGTSGSGKSMFASLLLNQIAKNKNIKRALIDMDGINSSIDIYNDIPIKNIMQDIINNIELGKYNREYINELLYVSENKTSYLTNNLSLYDMQNKIDKSHYNKIFESVNNYNDFVIVDLPSIPFFDVVKFSLDFSSIIFFVINPNYISIRQAIKYLEILNKLWNIPKSNINLVVNKVTKYSLTTSQIKSFLKGYKIICEIDYEEKVEQVINGGSSVNHLEVDMRKILNLLDLEYNKEEKSVFMRYLDVSKYLQRR